LDEVDIGIEDLNGEEIYLNIPLQRGFYNDLIADRVNDTIHAAKETLSRAGYTANDVAHILWVGEATHYKPLRDKVSIELGIKGYILAANPITAVAEGASIFAESIFGSKIGDEKREIVGCRNRLLDTYVGMDLLRNPFYILKATQRDDRNKIIELAEKQSLLSDADKCIEARAELTMPRKRVSAEVAWLPGVNPERVYDILLLLESSVGNRLASDNTTSIAPVDSLTTVLLRAPYTEKSTIADEVLETLKLSKEDFTEVSEFLGIRTLTPIARANLLAARLLRLPDYTPDGVAEWIRTLVQTFENINLSEVQAILNVEREVSSFPAIMELSDITSEIQNCRRYYQQVIKFALDNIYSAKARVKVVMTIVEFETDSDTNRWPILVEDTVDAYGDSAAAFLETEEKNIEALEKKIRIAADEETSDPFFHSIVDELLQTIEDWYMMVQPIQLSKNRQGLRHKASHDVADRVRLLAIYLFNEYNELDISQEILNMLKDVFIGIPEIAERVTADLEALNRIAEQREQQIF
ncbi:MAG: Hsp70 family protein, partial [Candidatus Poribacteria bacterium]|nr:Hsp70 family protein [Candidatus Poribacteria bacterium]